MTASSKTSPPLKWHGGKHYLTRHILDLMPRHLHYVEPFFGGGQVLFARDPADPHLLWDGLTSDGRRVAGVSEVINDIDSDLMNLYAVIKDPETFGRLQLLLGLTLNSQAEWETAKATLESGQCADVERAAALFVCCRQSLSGRKDAFAPTVRTRLRGGRNDGVNGWLSAVEGLPAVHARLRTVRILCKPALDVIRSEDTPGTLFYCDPPYLHDTRTARDVYGDHEMSDDDHGWLLDALLTVQGKVIISGYANDLYDTVLKGWKRHTVELPNHAASGKSKRRMEECLWCNF